MIDDQERPILVTGLGRSGTTWMQSFLSQHRRIHIHGQSPNISWETVWHWYRTLLNQGEWSQWANRHTALDVPHYAGSDPDRAHAVFKRMFHDYFTGNGSAAPRWGLKWLDLPGRTNAGQQFEQLWPHAHWVVCVRDLFRTIESAKNTFVPQLDIRGTAEAWVHTCQFIATHEPTRVTLVQLDHLAAQPLSQRVGALRQVLYRLGEAPTAETDAFTLAWPVVHKVKPEGERTFRLTADEKVELLRTVPGLKEHIERLGY